MRRAALILLLSCVGLIAGCGDVASDGIECVQDQNCNREPTGKCVQAPSGRKWCAYGDTTCPSGLRYDAEDIGDGLANTCVAAESPDAGQPDAGLTVDASTTDASTTDGSASVTYELAYGSVFTLDAPAPVVTAWSVVINTGAPQLDLSTLQVLSVADDHPNAVTVIRANPHGALIDTGFAGGYVLQGLIDPIFNSGLVTEPRTDFEGGGANSLLEIYVEAGAPKGAYDINVTATIAINNVPKQISILVHFDSNAPSVGPTGFTRN